MNQSPDPINDFDPAATDTTTEWYVRRGARIHGPYTARQLERYLLLGRILPSDKFSAQGDHWETLADHEELIPEAMRDLDTDSGRQRFLAARKQADERDHDQGQMPGPDYFEERSDRRRDPRQVEMEYLRLLSRQQSDQGMQARLTHPVLVAGGLAMVIVTVILGIAVWGGHQGVVAPGKPDCRAPAAVGVNWQYCAKDQLDFHEQDFYSADMRNISARLANFSQANMRHADLSYGKFDKAIFHRAQLQEARLVGAELRDAQLQFADLTDADLSFANLLGADISQANLQNTRLGAAIWIDGRRCGEASLGDCLPE